MLYFDLDFGFWKKFFFVGILFVVAEFGLIVVELFELFVAEVELKLNDLQFEIFDSLFFQSYFEMEIYY